MNNSDCIICLEHVDTRFGGQVIHHDLNLCVHRGEILALVGGSGSGKTTLLREMIGLQVPAAGCITVDGQRLAESDAYAQQCLRERCGVLFQGGALFSALNVFDNVALPLRELDLLDQSLIAQLVCHKLAMVGLDTAVAHRKPAELSGGMVKRVGLARALALEPEFLFLDEPTSGLDPVAGQQFVELIRGLHRELGFTVVLVTHDLDTMVDLADRIAVLADQHIVALGRLNEVIACDHPFVHDFFGGTRGQRALAAQEAR
ncbi:ATP-binding cassette domain-containing protein [Rhodanobacter sp. OR444]|uniref:ABC transporter ATP-binding protein n=1 Tax=Rhodanobacter sp. OR444 TaxID=1076525 RepID=UPI000412C14E|nr:ATP-binding cassette domain-containing protein [Rhodanobacter sp. OR444]